VYVVVRNQRKLKVANALAAGKRRPLVYIFFTTSLCVVWFCRYFFVAPYSLCARY